MSMPPSHRPAYHHGDLRATLLAMAHVMLEEENVFSLRALARRAGVSQTAPYRHFPDRAALEVALATDGFTLLSESLGDEHALPSSVDELADFAAGYVGFALRRPALFRLMFGSRCGEGDPRLTAAAEDLRQRVARVLANVFPAAPTAPLVTAVWGLVHGLAFLYLDGKLDPGSPVEGVERVREACLSLLRSLDEPGAARAVGP